MSKADRKIRGRPRSADADAAILAATLELLDEGGYPAVTIDDIARRAGVARTTVYRRFPSRGDAVLAAAEEVARRRVVVPDTGSLRGDLVALLSSLANAFTQVRTRRVMPSAIAALGSDPKLERFVRTLWAARGEALTEVLERGRDRGELSSDADLELLADLLFGPLYYRLLVSGAPIERDLAERITDAVLAGQV